MPDATPTIAPDQDEEDLPRVATAELLAIGAELLVGETRDTNSGDLAASLTELGVEVTRMTQLPDDLEVVADAVSEALARVDLVVTTGGLGPTPDDLTREAIAKAIGATPAVDPELEAWLRDIWERRGLPFSDTNLKQAWLVPGAVALANPLGTAPGWWVPVGSRVIIALPGPPRELQPMWQEHALAHLRSRGLGVDRAAETLRLTGIGESLLVDLIGSDVLTTANPRIATYARADSVDVRVSAYGEDGKTARAIVDGAIAELSPRLDTYVYAHGEQGWPEALADRLGGRRLSVVEAGTSGYVGLLLGSATWLVHGEQHRDVSGTEARAAAERLAHQIDRDSGAEASLAAVAYETGDDMRVEICVIVDGESSQAEQSVFRGGDAGRRRAANAAIAQLWRRLAD